MDPRRTFEDGVRCEPVFVFGSNLAGQHSGGAARHAVERYGAVLGVGEGPTGHAYALPTMTDRFEPRPLADIKASVEAFLAFARDNHVVIFNVTRVGCGIADFTDMDIASLFAGAPDNVVLPIGWRERADGRRTVSS